MNDENIIKSPDTFREQRVPPGQRARKDWPVLHHGGVPGIDTAKWTLTISGLVDRECVLTYQEFTTLPRVQVYSDIHCVTGWSRLDNLWEGIGTGEIKRLVTVRPEAGFVVVHAESDFTTNLSIEDFFQPDALFALSHGGKQLSPEHGFPVRLVVPRLYFWKSAKWVTGLEFVKEDRPGFWESYGYHNHGDPWKEERYSD